MTLKPLQDRIVAKKETPAEKTASGFFMPGDAKEKPSYATVESVGPDVKHVKKGDKIIFKEYSTTDIKLNNQDYLIVKEEDVLATID
jgi:chaperonin 10 Kd subunit